MTDFSEIVKKEYIENDPTLCFQTTPLSKIIILNIVSGGIYGALFLSYGYWKTLKERFGYKISPVWRAIFSMLTNFKLFPILEKYFKNFELSGRPFIGLSYAGGFFGAAYLSNRLSTKSLQLSMDNHLTLPMNILLEFVTLLLTLLLTYIFYVIQVKINKINALSYPNAPQNPWKVSNLVWAIILGIFTIWNFLSV